MKKWMRAAAVIATTLLALSACAAPVSKATQACDAAFKLASEQMNTLYATHPFYGPDYDALYEDGEISDEEQVKLDAMMADEEAQFNSLVDPVYDACKNVEDLYVGAYAYKDVADWALLESEYVSREETKAFFIVGYCNGNQERRACADYEPNDWR